MHMHTLFKRFAAVWVVVSMILWVVQRIKGHDPSDALEFALTWAFVSAAIYAGSALYRIKRQQICGLCASASIEQVDTSSHESDKSSQ